MKVIILSLTILLASFSMPNANAAVIMSGFDDLCDGCTLSGQFGALYVQPDGTTLDGATWIQNSSAWGVVTTYSIFEADLEGTNKDYVITSLFVAYDDFLTISSGSQILFEARNYRIPNPWMSIVDVISLTGELTFNSADGLKFFVDNLNGGPTAVIWKGEIQAVSAPSVMGLMGLSLALLCGMRRKKIGI